LCALPRRVVVDYPDAQTPSAKPGFLPEKVTFADAAFVAGVVRTVESGPWVVTVTTASPTGVEFASRQVTRASLVPLIHVTVVRPPVPTTQVTE